MYTYIRGHFAILWGGPYIDCDVYFLILRLRILLKMYLECMCTCFFFSLQRILYSHKYETLLANFQFFIICIILKFFLWGMMTEKKAEKYLGPFVCMFFTK